MKMSGETITATLDQKIGFGGTGVAETAKFMGTGTAATIGLSDAGKAAAFTSLTVSNTAGGEAKIEKLTLELTGKNQITQLAAASLHELVITGTGSLKSDDANANLGAATTIKSIDASKNSGGVELGLTVANFSASGVTLNGGAGNDTFTLNATTTVKMTANLGLGDDNFTVAGNVAFGAGSVIDGGSGSDTLTLSNTATSLKAANASMFKGFEHMVLTGAGNTYAKGTLADVTSYTLAAGTAQTLENFATGDSFTVRGAAGSAVVSLADDSGVDTLSFTLDNGLKVAGTGSVVNLDATGVEVISLHSKGLVTGIANSVTLTGGSLAGVQQIAAEGDQTFKLVTGASTGLSQINTSKVSANVEIDASGIVGTTTTHKLTVITGDGNDVISSAVGGGTAANAKMASFITAGKGADIIKLAGTGTNNVGDSVIVGKEDSISTAYDTISGFDHAAGGGSAKDTINLKDFGFAAGATVGAVAKSVTFAGTAADTSAMSVGFTIAENQRAGFFGSNAVVYKTGADETTTATLATMVFVDTDKNCNWDATDTVILLVGDYSASALVAGDFVFV